MTLHQRLLWFGKMVNRHWLTIGFVLGFCTDLFLLNQIDNLVDNLILLFYVLLATTAFLLFYVGVAERLPGRFGRLCKRYTPLLMQYSFGGLLSGMLIFYGRSGDWLASAPFLLLIASVIVANEFVEKRSDRLIYQLALYFIGLFSYVVLVVPVITGRMGDGVFIASGLLALAWVIVVVQMLYKIVPRFMELNTQRIIVTIGFIYIGFNSLYFLNVIPPIPLSLTELQMVHSVDRLSNGNYRVVEEVQPWFRRSPFIRPVLHPTDGQIACFARVYAPTNITTDIYHRWEYQDENGAWQERFRLGYEISGSNAGGYRGYTRLTNYSSGLWRCSVETERGQVLGREVVRVIINEPPEGTITVIE